MISFQNTQMTIISFHEVDFSFDLGFIQKSLAESKAILKQIIERHLTDKSLNRVDEVYNNQNIIEIKIRL